MIHRERRELCIGNELPGRGDFLDQLRQDLAASLRRIGHPDRLTVEPFFDQLPIARSKSARVFSRTCIV